MTYFCIEFSLEENLKFRKIASEKGIYARLEVSPDLPVLAWEYEDGISEYVLPPEWYGSFPKEQLLTKQEFVSKVLGEDINLKDFGSTGNVTNPS
jgi:hypothetical protein